jgi:modification target Cys-rich repeat protein
MSKLIRFQPLTALAVTGFAIASLTGAGCNKVADAQKGLCCSEFQVGADLTAVDFELDGTIKGQYTALAQASADLGAVAAGAITDVALACENIARDLGADGAEVDAAVANTGSAKVTAVCKLATAQIDATFGAKAEVKGKLTVDFQEPVCTASFSAQAKCEGSCSGDVKCDAEATLPKCEGGKLSVECKADCDATVETPKISCTGSCGGKCEGSCKAEAGATVTCEGTCEGTCSADAAGGTTMNGVQADGSCMGKCDGKCTAKAGASVDCKGTCEGTCDATCKASPGVAKIKCDGECKGDFEAPKCEGGSAKVECDADVDCKANCSASASAKAECKPPSLNIAFAVTGTATAEAQAKIDVGLASLKANLPNLIVVLKARGAAFTAGIKGTLDASGSIAAHGGDLSTKATACLIPIGAAIQSSLDDFGATLKATASVTASAGVK